MATKGPYIHVYTYILVSCVCYMVDMGNIFNVYRGIYLYICKEQVLSQPVGLFIFE